MAELNVDMLPDTKMRWLPRDEDLIYSYAQLPISWVEASEILGRRLGRTAKSVRRKAESLGVKASNSQISKHQGDQLLKKRLRPVPSADR